MPSYLSPGVYVEEVSYRSTPIEGVSTSTAGLVGSALKGPPGKPTLVTSYSQYQQIFGGAFKQPIADAGQFLPNAVQAFFDNGGQEAFIVRVLGPGNQTATAYIDNNTPTGLVSALYAGDAGNEISVQVSAPSRPPVKIAPATFNRVRPAIRTGFTWSAASGANYTFTLGADTVANLRIGDAILVSDALGRSVYLQISSIAPAEVAVDDISSSTGTFSTQPIAGVLVTKSDGSGAQVFFELGGSDPTGDSSSTSTLSLPHRIAAILAPGDQLTFVDSTDAAVLDYSVSVAQVPAITLSDAVTLTQPTSVFGTNNTSNPFVANSTFSFQNATLTLTYTADRLIVAEPHTLVVGDRIAVTDGSTYWSGASVLYTDSTGMLLLGNHPEARLGSTLSSLYGTTPGDADNVSPSNWWEYQFGSNNSTTNLANPGPGYTLNQWRFVEKLHVGVASVNGGPSTLQMSAVGTFYTGAAVKLPTAPNGPGGMTVVNAIDSASKILSVSPGFTEDIYLPVDPSKRGAAVQIVELMVSVLEDNSVVETFANLSWNPDTSADSYQKYYLSRINDDQNGSAYISIAALAPPAADGTVFVPADALAQWGVAAGGSPRAPIPLTGGNDGGTPGSVDLIGYDDGPGHRTGIQAMLDESDIDICAVPGATDEAVQAALITHCERQRYRFAVLDGRQGVSDVTQIQKHRDNYDTEYAAYYAPWFKVLDTFGNTLIVPPSGAMIGIYAQTDNTRGVFKAPANVVVANILEPEIKFGKGEQDILNPIGVNLIRTFPGNGTRVWGARTLSSDADWKYINVRRLFIYLENSIDQGTQWVVFEPNNPHLWARVEQTIESFLTGVWKTGALMGTKPSEGFFVKVDETTMTQDDIDNGRLVCLIGVAPTNPAEFVIFRIGQWTANSSS